MCKCKKVLILLVICLSLVIMGCISTVPKLPPPTNTIETDIPVPPPTQWKDYCKRHPEDEACK